MTLAGRGPASPAVNPRSGLAEIVLVSVVGLLGVALRLAWIRLLPTLPVSDFASVLDFASALARDFAATDALQWYTLSPGASLLLSFGIRAGVGTPIETARTMTALAIGLVPLIPVLAWRGVAPFSVRAAAGLLLAVWPGQVAFSGVVAQDSWSILPAVALGTLAVRTCLDGTPRPIAAGALLGLGFLMRQELLVVLAPLALGGAGLVPLPARRGRIAAPLAATVAVVLLLAAGHRYAGSGRFALTTTHGSLAVLCSTVPGASWAYNAPPYSYLETYAPGRDRHEAALGLVRRELARRPVFHAVRAFYFTFAPLFRSSRESLYWSLGPASLPEGARERGARLVAALKTPLTWEMRLVVWAGFAALALGLASRNTALLLLALSVCLKLGIHALTVSQPRYYFPVTALVLLAAPPAAWMAYRARGLRTLALASAAAVISAASLEAATGIAERWTRAHDDPIEYRFALRDESGRERLRCRTANAGIWAWALKPDERPVSFFRPDPVPGDVAEVACELPEGADAKPATLEIDVPDLVAGGFVQLAIGRAGERPAVLDADRLAGGRPLEVALDPERDRRATVQLRRTERSPERGLGHAATVTLRLKLASPGSSAARIIATPNPIPVCDGTGLGATRVAWSAPPESLVEVRVDSVGGELFWPASRGGEWSTGKRVADGTLFLLVSPASGATPAREIARLRVGVTREGCP